MKNHFSILIIDDNPADSNLLKRYIGNISYWNVETDMVANAENAIELYRLKHHDFIFVDYLLGSTNGLELINFFINAGLKANFILLTGYGNEAIAQEAMRAGAIDYLNKNNLSTDIVARTIRHHQQRIETETKFKKNESKISNLLESTGSGLINLSSSGTILDINKPCCQFLGYSNETPLLGKKIMDFVPTKQAELFQEFLTECNKKKTISAYRIEFHNQKNIETVLSINALYDDEIEDRPSIFAICRNITEQSQYEKRLQQAKLKAEESDRLKTSFLSNMSHEIRTPMNAIIGFTDLLAEDDADAETKLQYIDLIKESGNGLLRLINDIIDISQLETTDFVFHKTTVDLAKLLAELKNYAISELNKQEKELDLRINLNNYPEEKRAFIDPYRLKQILSNFISNSIKFTDKGFVELGIKIQDNNTQIYIKDTGIGIHPEKQDFIFDRFRKIEDDKNRLYRGAGLGLTIAQRLTQRMGGEIGVESDFNVGSTFFITFSNELLEKTEQINKETHNPIQEFNWNDKLILIAEDEKINYKFLEKALKKTQVKIYWAKNGHQAIQLANEYDFNIILMDMKMPGLDGYQATKIIKQNKQNCTIIAQTAYAMSGEKDAIMEAGCDDYLAKPIKRAKLLKTIAKYI